MYQKNEDRKYALIITAVLLAYGLWLAVSINTAFATPRLIHAVVTK